ncbi:hypothetical protein [Streptomyces lavenduligriseus]|uniref:Secreted protein n=1 Tax=Streptomyces lavenduligriseus TaxID=67315 RepID=A0ABT0P3H1_9ACTN|nr:hypothetical protein [Streptomyces lavenduligriseus]MCL3998136.1 hypothetical protein [Streptomyces lavenduligriseus]
MAAWLMAGDTTLGGLFRVYLGAVGVARAQDGRRGGRGGPTPDTSHTEAGTQGPSEANPPTNGGSGFPGRVVRSRRYEEQDPATWLQPATGYRCQYATDWVADKNRWGLSIGSGEEAALAQILSHCPNTPITVTLAR